MAAFGTEHVTFESLSSNTTTTTSKLTSQNVSPIRNTTDNTQLLHTTTRVEEVYTLTDFVERYKQLLPLRIKVVEGFCGKEERSVISTGDLYNFHSVKNERFMTMQDEEGSCLSIPLSSLSVTLGLIYDPMGDTVKAKSGYHFRTIGELTSYYSHPRVIKATKTFNSGDQRSSVTAEEVLVIKKVDSTENKYTHIKAFSLFSRKEKTLYKDCEGHFITDPSSIQLHLTDIVEFFSACLPMKAVLSLNSDIVEECNEKISNLESEMVTLMCIKAEPALVATTCWDGEEAAEVSPNPEHDHVSLSVPVDLKIKVAVL